MDGIESWTRWSGIKDGTRRYKKGARSFDYQAGIRGPAANDQVPQKSPESNFDRVAKMEPMMGGSGRGRAVCSIFLQLPGGVMLVSA